MTSTQRKRRRRGRGRASSKALLGLSVVIALAVLAGLSAVGYVVSIAASAPPLSSLKPEDPGSFTTIVARDGEQLGVIQNDELRKPISSTEIPDVLKQATVAIEDERFYEHKGIDYQGVIRAAVKNLSSKKTVQGGSTITMQLIRNLYIDDERTYSRKIKEAKLAEELENAHPGRKGKEWILNEYLNAVPYGTVGGQSAIGVWAAAKMYFDKAPKDLELHEAALIAGIPQATDSYNPIRHDAAATGRRNEVLRRMASVGYITPGEAQEAIDRPLDLNPSSYFQARREKFFFDYVQDQLFDALGAAKVRAGGLRVRTTIDLKKQKAARDAIAGRLGGIGPSGAVVTINPKNGEILAMASSANYSSAKYNLAAQGRRQPGSSFKTMALMAAIKRGIDPDSTSYVSKPLKFTDPAWGPIEVKTYDNSYSGSISLTRATLKSDNSVYTQLALDVGPQSVKQTAYEMGITTKLDGYPAETLGGLTIGVSPLEMANAYATIASGGYRNRPIAITKIRLRDGTTLEGKDLPKKLRPKRVKVFKDGVTSEVTRILKMNVESGTGTKAQIGCSAAGKTGTTDKHSDAWFVGYTPRLATSVWVGYPKAQIYMTSEYHGSSVAGGTYPAEIWGDYMRKAKGGYCGEFPKPKEPLAFTKFFGKYATGKSSTGSGYDQYNGGQYVPPSNGGAVAPAPSDEKKKKDDGEGNGNGGGNNGNGNGNGNGTQEFDPDLYESPPQEAPGTPEGGASPETDG
jgi:penicillin-binding protein 1A